MTYLIKQKTKKLQHHYHSRVDTKDLSGSAEVEEGDVL